VKTILGARLANGSYSLLLSALPLCHARKYASRYSDNAKRGDIDMSHRKEAEKHIQNLEDILVKNPYLLGDKQTIADIAIFPFMRQFSNVEPEWWAVAPYPKTRDWLTRHTESELFKSIMTKYPLWKTA